MRYFDSFTWNDAEQYVSDVHVSIQAILHALDVLGNVREAAEIVRVSGDPARAERHDELVQKMMGHVAEQRWNGLTMLPKKLR